MQKPKRPVGTNVAGSEARRSQLITQAREHNASNPWLDSGQPDYSRLKVEHVQPAFKKLLEDVTKLVAELEASTEEPTWDNLIAPLEEQTRRLGDAENTLKHLKDYRSTEKMKEAYNAVSELIARIRTLPCQSPILLAKFKQLSENPDVLLPAERKSVIDKKLLEFRLAGAELQDEQKKARLQEIRAELQQWESKFGANTIRANDGGIYEPNRKRLKGIPQDLRERARKAAEDEGKPGYKFSLKWQEYYRVMACAKNRELRKELHRAFCTKASELSLDAEEFGNDNMPVIQKIQELRQEQAELLGLENYAQLSLLSKTFDAPEEATAFLEDVIRRVRPTAKKEYEELSTFARKHLGIDPLEQWDVIYAVEQLRLHKHNISMEKIKKYFPAEHVMAKVFEIMEKLFSVEIKKDTASVWHKDVTSYRVERNGEVIGQFYLDPYARAGKKWGGWTDEIRRRCKLPDGSIRTPVACLSADFIPPKLVDGKKEPTLLPLDRAKVLFHECGHLFHALLTNVDEYSDAGFLSVPVDVIEWIGTFLENLFWDALPYLTKHVDTGEPMPEELINQVKESKNFRQGTWILNQAVSALFDMRLHSQHDPQGGQTAQDVLNSVVEEFGIFPPEEYNRYAATFDHLFNSIYPAGYYAYLLSQIMGDHAYMKLVMPFFSEDEMNRDPSKWRKIGKKLEEEVLAVGGSVHPLVAYVNLVGEGPKIESTLELHRLAGAA